MGGYSLLSIQQSAQQRGTKSDSILIAKAVSAVNLATAVPGHKFGSDEYQLARITVVNAIRDRCPEQDVSQELT